VRTKDRERETESEKERQKERVFIFKKNDGCLGTFELSSHLISERIRMFQAAYSLVVISNSG